MNLLIDVGNSRLKWRLEGGNDFNVATSIEQLDAQWQAIDATQSPSRIIACNVRGEAIAKALEQLASIYWKLDIEWQFASAEACGVVNAYASPTDLGADRWVALIAARALYPASACVVVDAGTAITVDLLSMTGEHCGGVIMPGARLMLDALRTAEQLSPDARDLLAAARAPARNTQDAIAAGVFFSLTGGVRAAIEQQAARISVKIGDIPIIITGGDADMLQLKPLQTDYKPPLVLDGLQVLATQRMERIQ